MDQKKKSNPIVPQSLENWADDQLYSTFVLCIMYLLYRRDCILSSISVLGGRSCLDWIYYLPSPYKIRNCPLTYTQFHKCVHNEALQTVCSWDTRVVGRIKWLESQRRDDNQELNVFLEGYVLNAEKNMIL